MGTLEAPTSWISPIGLACVQPYKQVKKANVMTKRQKISLQEDDGMRVNKIKQKMGFPPNFVHSLDSTHMMMVAEGCKRAGITFAGVHDSFWTHACDAPILNKVIREAFVELHEKPIMQELYEDLQVQLGGVPAPELPEQGTLDISKVRDSKY